MSIIIKNLIFKSTSRFIHAEKCFLSLKFSACYTEQNGCNFLLIVLNTMCERTWQNANCFYKMQEGEEDVEFCGISLWAENQRHTTFFFLLTIGQKQMPDCPLCIQGDVCSYSGFSLQCQTRHWSIHGHSALTVLFPVAVVQDLVHQSHSIWVFPKATCLPPSYLCRK